MILDHRCINSANAHLTQLPSAVHRPRSRHLTPPASRPHRAATQALRQGTRWHQIAHVSDGREPHSSPHTGLNATHAAHSRLTGGGGPGAPVAECRRVLRAWPSAVGRTSFIASRWAVISRATRPSAGVSIRGERDPWAAGRLVPGQACWWPEAPLSGFGFCYRRLGNSRRGCWSASGLGGHSEAGGQGLVVVQQHRCRSEVENRPQRLSAP
jgi:hypothetical protein